MPNTPSVRIDIIIHATEDTLKILESAYNTLGVPPETFEMSHTRGHYRNPITMATATLYKSDAIQFIKMLCDKLGPRQIDDIIGTLSTRIDNSTLYLRISRQDIIRNGAATLYDSGTIRIKVHTPVYDERAENAFTKLLCRD